MFEVVGFYKFFKISYLKKNQKVLLETLKKRNIRGTIIISKEGVNGTISGKAEDIKFTINNLKRAFKFKEFKIPIQQETILKIFYQLRDIFINFEDSINCQLVELFLETEYGCENFFPISYCDFN